MAGSQAAVVAGPNPNPNPNPQAREREARAQKKEGESGRQMAILLRQNCPLFMGSDGEEDAEA